MIIHQYYSFLPLKEAQHAKNAILCNSKQLRAIISNFMQLSSTIYRALNMPYNSNEAYPRGILDIPSLILLGHTNIWVGIVSLKIAPINWHV